MENVPAALKGELTHWLLEIKSGVYIGHVNAMVRDKLWEKCVKARKKGRIFQAWSTNNEQHFDMRLDGFFNKEVVNWEGLLLIRINKHKKMRFGQLKMST